MQTFYHGSHRQFEKFDISVLRSVRSRGAKTFVWFVLSFFVYLRSKMLRQVIRFSRGRRRLEHLF
jgi:hypothetical protein